VLNTGNVAEPPGERYLRWTSPSARSTVYIVVQHIAECSNSSRSSSWLLYVHLNADPATLYLNASIVARAWILFTPAGKIEISARRNPLRYAQRTSRLHLKRMKMSGERWIQESRAMCSRIIRKGFAIITFSRSFNIFSTPFRFPSYSLSRK